MVRPWGNDLRRRRAGIARMNARRSKTARKRDTWAALEKLSSSNVLVLRASFECRSGTTPALTMVWLPIARPSLNPSSGDLSAIDANSSKKGDQAFGFSGSNKEVVANSVTWSESSGNTIVQADVNGDTT